MTRVTYGFASSAFHSIRPLQVLAEESDHDSFRIATLNDMYVDDLLSGSSDTESAIQLQVGFINTLGKAGSENRKRTSNDKKLVEQLPVHYREAADEMTIKSDEYVFKTLGIKWNPVPDHFSFAVNLSEQIP